MIMERLIMSNKDELELNLPLDFSNIYVRPSVVCM